MKATDLRIGNAVVYNQTIYKVDSICNSKNYVFLILFDEGVRIKASLNLISPVPLVVEILSHLKSLNSNDKDSLNFISLNQDTYFLHKLQNLYYITTGKELIV